jgi:tetratricopeptide (TPR) repeat protein
VDLTAHKRTRDRPGEAEMLRCLGSSMAECAAPDEALATLRAARKLAEDVGDAAGAAMAGRDIGYVLGLTGRLDEAETHLRAAATELGRMDRRTTTSMALSSLGFVLREQGKLTDAEAATRAALDLARSCGYASTEAYAARVLAGVLRVRGRARESGRAAQRAAALFERIGDPIGAAQSLRLLGEALAMQPDRLPDAERALHTAAKIFRDRGHEWGLALTELSLGEMEVQRGANDAFERLRRTLRYWTDEQVPALQARTMVALGRAAEQAGDPAAQHLLLAADKIYAELNRRP